MTRRLGLGIQLLQTAALVVALGWMIAHPVQALSERPGPGPRSAAAHRRRAVGADYASEAEALAAYLEHLDRVFDLGLVLSGRVDIAALRAARTRAHRCEILDCPGLEPYMALADATGRAVPPRPRWSGGDRSARRAIGVYVEDLQGRLERALPQAPELLPSEAQRLAALDCPELDCRALYAYLSVARSAFKAAGQPMPPPPELKR